MALTIVPFLRERERERERDREKNPATFSINSNFDRSPKQ